MLWFALHDALSFAGTPSRKKMSCWFCSIWSTQFPLQEAWVLGWQMAEVAGNGSERRGPESGWLVRLRPPHGGVKAEEECATVTAAVRGCVCRS